MALYYPDNLEHNNPNYALAEDIQFRGGATSVLDLAERNAIPLDKRKLYAIVSYNDSGVKTKRYDGLSVDDIDWQNDSNWSSIGDGGGFSFGLENQIPTTNSTSNDFDYTQDFTFDGTKLLVSDGNFNLIIGEGAGDGFKNESFNTVVGRYALVNTESGGSVAVGNSAGALGSPGSPPAPGDSGIVVMGNNLSFGNSAGKLDFLSGRAMPDSTNNVAIGQSAGYDNYGSYNIALGSEALAFSLSERTTAIGYQAGRELSPSYANQKDESVIIGYRALEYSIGDISDTVAIGAYAGKKSKGTGNVLIGAHAGEGQLLDDQLFISNSSTSDPLIYGDFNLERLRVNGSFEIRDVANIQEQNVMYYNPTTGLVTYGLPVVSGSGGSSFFDGGRGNEVYLPEDNIECGSSSDIQNVYIDCGESIRIL